mmetsp:Transcript_156627/g.272562  ORF Transcript_156627/g.272562 Transcript_156627/m.272562 type:complete len:132 (-) Transcript_156627:33-428(-)
MKNAGIEGPVFVSVGTPEKVSLFLDKNPTVPRSSLFADASEDFDAYNAAGFSSKIGDLEPSKDLSAPDLSAGQWFAYLSNVFKLSPTENIEGVKQLGGSYVVRGGELVFQHSDTLPGDEAPVEEILAAAGA